MRHHVSPILASIRGNRKLAIYYKYHARPAFVPDGVSARHRKILRRRFKYWLVTTVVHLARLMPRPAGHRLFSAIGGLAGRLFRKYRRGAVDNLAIAFPESDVSTREAIASAMFRTLGRNVFDFLQFKGSSADRLALLVDDVSGRAHLQEAVSAGRGVIAISGHIGCWELVAAWLTSIGHPITVVARQIKNARFNEEVIAMRASLGVTTVDRDASPRKMIKPLKRREFLGVLIDQHTDVGGIHVSFFGKPAFTPSGVAKLACLTGAPILPIADVLNRNGKHSIHILPPIWPPGVVKDRSETVRQLTESCSLAVERLIRIDPTQWVWFHRRWRVPDRPDVEPEETSQGYGYGVGRELRREQQ